jgi:hypothetical protein
MSLEVLLLINCNFEKVVASYLRTDVYSFRISSIRRREDSAGMKLGQWKRDVKMD